MKTKEKLERLLSNKLAVEGGIITILLLLLAIFAPVIAADPLAVKPVDRLKAPSVSHIFGTDTFGRDLFSRIIYGARVSMLVGFFVVIGSGIIGMAMGLLAGYFKKIDGILMRICDSLKAIPSVLLAISLMAIWDKSIKNVILALIIVNIPDIARVTRSAVIVVRDQLYIEAMKAAGAKSSRIILHHILPNVLSPVIIQASYVFATTIITEAALSFMGVGVPAPKPSWGNILLEGKTVINKAWWMITFPGIFTAISVLGLNLFGDGIRDVLDPKTK